MRYKTLGSRAETVCFIVDTGSHLCLGVVNPLVVDERADISTYDNAKNFNVKIAFTYQYCVVQDCLHAAPAKASRSLLSPFSAPTIIDDPKQRVCSMMGCFPVICTLVGTIGALRRKPISHILEVVIFSILPFECIMLTMYKHESYFGASTVTQTEPQALLDNSTIWLDRNACPL